MSGPSGARAQVERLLAMVPYLQERGAVPIEQVAEEFGVSARQVVQDLKVLWFCGLPGAMPGDLIEVDMDVLEGEGVIHVSNADYLDRPLRLDASEAAALIVALRTLREVGVGAEPEALERALAKLEAAAGSGVPTEGQVDVQLAGADQVPTEVADAVATGLQEGRRLHLSYLVPARDETTERDVDPLRLVLAEGHRYLQAWCHRAQDYRLFRLDRVVAARLLAVPAEIPADVEPQDVSEGVFQPSPESPQAVLELTRSAAWVADYYPVDEVSALPGGRLRVRLRAGDTDWFRRLVLRLGGQATVIEPPELAEQVRRSAAQALSAYESGE